MGDGSNEHYGIPEQEISDSPGTETARVDCNGTGTGNGDSFLDEPTTYLDIRYQIEILELVKKLNREYGMTVIMVLHEINQAIYFSDRIIGLCQEKF